MTRTILSLLLCFLFAIVVSINAQTPPTISEVFSSSTSVVIQLYTFNFTGKGIWSADQPNGKSVSQFDFEGNHPFNEYRLTRYDLNREWEMLDQEDCHSFRLEGTMEPIWGWLSFPEVKYSRVEFQGRTYDAWSLVIGYAAMTLGVVGNTPIFFITQSPARNVTVQFLNFAPTVTNTSVFNVPNNCPNNDKRISVDNKPLNQLSHAFNSLVGCVGRSAMIDRAQVWVERHIPYNQGATYQGYREDCSGYVSMAWESSKPGHTTYTLPQISHPISKSELKEGDVLLCQSEHVVLFGGWADSGKTHYTAYEETRPGEGTVKRVTPYPYWYNTACFHPYRYNEVC